ncbi:Tn3 family transposase [Streptomyces sp. NBC_01207]|nr:Tn3 family transposase [Streptomyces sp. NBC_01207]
MISSPITRYPVTVGSVRFASEPTPGELEQFFRLDRKGRELVAGKRWDATGLGFAVQWGTVRMLGTFLVDDLVAAPSSTVVFVAEQLQLNPACLADFTARPKTAYEHTREIRDAYGYRKFSASESEVRAFLAARVWASLEGPRALFDRAVYGPLREDSRHTVPAEHHRGPPPPRQEDLLRAARRTTPALPRGNGGPAGALGLALNALVLWRSVYLGAATKRLAADGFPVTNDLLGNDLLGRLSPLQFDHINFPGRYAFFRQQDPGRRPLRDAADTAGSEPQAERGVL